VSALERINAMDDAVDVWLDRWRGGPLDRLFYGLSEAANHSILWHTLGTVNAALPGVPRRSSAQLGVVMGIESALVNGGLKSIVKRPRPEPREHTHQLRTPLTSSFPSGHASAAFTAAAVLTRSRPSARPVWYTLAVLVSASRVWVGIHHLSDVVGGIVVGRAIGRVAVGALDRIER
jgi:undecaprenyl-diphosphatase